MFTKLSDVLGSEQGCFVSVSIHTHTHRVEGRNFYLNETKLSIIDQKRRPGCRQMRCWEDLGVNSNTAASKHPGD